MARSICPRCGNGTFEMVQNEPMKSNFKVMFVQCTSCGAVVGVMDFFNIGALLKSVMKKLGID